MVVLTTESGISVSTSARTIEDFTATINLQPISAAEKIELRTAFVIQQNAASAPAPPPPPTENEINQIRSAIASGANVSATLLRRAGVSTAGIQKVQTQQAAIRTIKRVVPEVGGRFDLVKAFRAGVSLKTIADAGFNPNDIDRAEKAIAQQKTAPAPKAPKITIPAAKKNPQATALATIKKIPGAEVEDGRFNLATAIRGGATITLLLEAGFGPKDLNVAKTAIRLARKARTAVRTEKPADLLAAGFTSKDLIDFGFTDREIGTAFNILQARGDVLVPEGPGGRTQRQQDLAAVSRIPGVKTGSKFDLVVALEAGVLVSTIKGAGFKQRDVSRAFNILQAKGDFDVPEGLLAAPSKVKVVKKATKDRVPFQEVPRPTPTLRPTPGERLSIPKDIQKDIKELRFQGASIAAATTVFPGALTATGGSRIAFADNIKRGIEQGDITPAEARVLLRTERAKPADAGDARDAAYFVPGLGTFLSFQDMQRSGFSPLTVGFFVLSTAADVIILFKPITASGAAAGRLTNRIISVPLANAARISPARVQEALRMGAKQTGLIVREERGSIRLPDFSPDELSKAFGKDIEAFGKKLEPLPATRSVPARPKVATKVAPAERPKVPAKAEPPSRALTPKELDKLFGKERRGVPAPTPKRPPVRKTRPEPARKITPEEQDIITAQERRRVLGEQLKRERATESQQKQITAAQRRQAAIDVQRENLLAVRRDAITRAKTLSSPRIRQAGLGAALAPQVQPSTKSKAKAAKVKPLTAAEANSLTQLQSRVQTLTKTEADRLAELSRRLQVQPLSATELNTLTRILNKTAVLTAAEVAVLAGLVNRVQAQPLNKTDASTLTELLTQTQALTKAQQQTLTNLLTQLQNLTKTETKALTEALAKTETLSKPDTAALTKLLTKPAPLTKPETEQLTQLLNKIQPLAEPDPFIRPIPDPFPTPEPFLAPLAEPELTIRLTPEPIPPVTPTPTVKRPPTRPPRRPPGEPPTRPPGEPPTRPPGEPVKTPTEGPPGKPPGPPPKRPPRFELPGGKRLKPGVFPRVIAFKLGFQDVRADLQTGEFTFNVTEVTGEPDKTFRVIEFTKTRPTARTKDMGIVDLIVTGTMLEFKRTKKAVQRKTIPRQKIRR